MNIKNNLKEAYAAKNEESFRQLLVDNPSYLNAAINLKGHWYTPLHLAVLNNWENSIEWLLERGAKVDVQDFKSIEEFRGFVTLDTGEKAEGGPTYYCQTALHFASGKSYKIVSTLLQNGANPNAQDFWGQTPLWGTLGNEPEEIASLALLLAHPSIDPDIPEDEEEYGDTPLHHAVREEYEQSIKLLILAGARTDIVNTEENMTAYELASPEIKLVISSALIEKARLDQRADATPSTKENAAQYQFGSIEYK